MDWRETVLGFSAHASPAVGGRYYVERLAGEWIVDHEARDLGGRTKSGVAVSIILSHFGSLTRWIISTISGPSGSEAIVCFGLPQPRSRRISAARSCASSFVLFSRMPATF